MTNPRPAPANRRFLRQCISLDARSLGIFRVGIALLILVDLADRTGSLRALWTDDGMVPRAMVEANSEGHAWEQSLHMLGGSYAFEATLDDDRKIDLFRDGAPVDYGKPGSFSSVIPSYRWRAYLLWMREPYLGEHLVHCERFLRDRWESEHPEGPRIRSVRILQMNEEFAGLDSPPKVEPIVLWPTSDTFANAPR